MDTLLFTGASGFLGINVKPLLSTKYCVKTLGLMDTDDYTINLAHEVPIIKECFDIVLHAAGKAHTIPKTAEEKKAFFDINLQGTKNLCSALEKNFLPKSLIFISTVAVYGIDYGEDILEDSPLNGKTPYALSKLQAEQFLIDWSRKHGVILGIIRPSLFAGPNPPGNLGLMIQGINCGRYFSISGGKAHKSVLMVQDIAALVPLLANKGGIYNVCDNQHPTFSEIERLIALQLNKCNPLSIPYWFAAILALLGDIIGENVPINSKKLIKMTKSLTFSNEKSKRELGWNPLNVLDNFIIK